MNTFPVGFLLNLDFRSKMFFDESGKSENRYGIGDTVAISRNRRVKIQKPMHFFGVN